MFYCDELKMQTTRYSRYLFPWGFHGFRYEFKPLIEDQTYRSDIRDRWVLISEESHLSKLTSKSLPVIIMLRIYHSESISLEKKK